MAKAIVDSLEGLSDQLKAEYFKVEAGHPLAAKHLGKFALKVDAVDGVEMQDVTGLKNSLSAARSERDEWKGKVLKLGDDFDVEAARAALAKVKEMDNWKPDDKVREQIDSAKRQLVEKHTKEVNDLRTALSARDREVEELLVDVEIDRAVLEQKGNPKLLRPAIKSSCRVVRGADGKPTVQILQADGKNIRLSGKSGSTENMTITEFVESLKSDDAFAPAFSGTGTKGVGAGSGQRSQGGQGQQGGSGGSGGSGGGSSGDADYVSKLREQRRQDSEGA